MYVVNTSTHGYVLIVCTNVDGKAKALQLYNHHNGHGHYHCINDQLLHCQSVKTKHVVFMKMINDRPVSN